MLSILLRGAWRENQMSTNHSLHLYLFYVGDDRCVTLYDLFIYIAMQGRPASIVSCMLLQWIDVADSQPLTSTARLHRASLARIVSYHWCSLGVACVLHSISFICSDILHILSCVLQNCCRPSPCALCLSLLACDLVYARTYSFIWK